MDCATDGGNSKSMSFSTALDVMKEGRKVTRSAWVGNDMYSFIAGKESFGGVVPNQRDMLANDWTIFEHQSEIQRRENNVR